MPYISDMPSPELPLSGLELLPALQGSGLPGNRGIPILVHNPAFGGAVLALRSGMLADLSATSDADPGAGNVRWNNADPNAASELYISDADSDSGDLSAALAGLAVGGAVYVQGGPPADRGNWQRWRVTSVDSETGYTRIGVALELSDGAFSNDDVLELTVQQPAPSPGVDRNVVTATSSTSGTLTLDASLGDYFTTTLHENVGTLTIANALPACTLGFWIQQAAGAYGFTFPSSFNWGDGGAPPAVDALDDGDTVFVVISTNNAGGVWDASWRLRA